MQAHQFVGQQTAERFCIHTIAWIGAADLRLKLEDGLTDAGVLEKKPRAKVGLGKAEVGIDRQRVRIYVKTQRACQLSRFLPAKKLPSRRNKDQFVRTMAHRGSRQSFDEELAIASFALFNRDKKMAVLFERILEGLVADGLYRLHLNAAPMRRLVSHDLSWIKVNRLSTGAGRDRSVRN